MVQNPPQDPAAYPAPLPAKPAALPRKGVTGWLMAYAIAVVLAWPALVVVLVFGVYGGLAGLWQVFREGGVYSFFCEFAYIATVIVLGLLGGVFISGRRLGGWVLFGIALVPFFVGLAGAALSHRTLMGVLTAHITPMQAIRIFAVGTAEERANLAFGSAMTALALLLASLAALGRIASIDAGAIDPQRARPARAAMGIAASVAVFGLLVGFAIRVSLKQFHTAFGLVILISTVAAAIVAASRAPLAAMLDHEPNAKEDIVRTLLLLAVSAAAAAVFVAVEGGALQMHIALNDMGAPSLEPAQRVVVLGDALAQAGQCYTIGLIDALLVLGALSVPVLRSGAAREGSRPGLSLVAWAASIFLLVGASAAYAHASSRDLAAVARPRAFELSGLSPPTAIGHWQDPDATATLFITRDGRLLLDASTGLNAPIPADGAALHDVLAQDEAADEREHPALVIDAEATYGFIVRAMAPVFAQTKGLSGDGGSEYRLVLAPARESAMNRRLPPEWALLGDEHEAVNVRFDNEENPRGSALAGGSRLIVVIGATSALVMSEDRANSQKISIGNTEFDDEQRQSVFRKLARGRLKHLLIAPREEDKLGTVVRILDSARDLADADFSVTLSASAPALEKDKTETAESAQASVKEEPPKQADGDKSSEANKSPETKSHPPEVHSGNISVTGRLPVGAIQYIVRKHYERFLECYEKGLIENPKLIGRVSVKFVIDNGGAVSDASDGGSDLPDPGVVQCVAHSFTALSFPQPEGGGTVSVVYPLLFSPGK